MNIRINWKAGILSAITVAIVGIGFFVFIGSNLDYSCKNTTPNTTGCKIFNGLNMVLTDYSDIFRSVFAKRCVGGNGPDDCLGPDALIMLITLLTTGFIVGNLLWRKSQKPKSGP